MKRVKNAIRKQKLISKYEAIILFVILVLIFLSALSKTTMIVG